MGTKPGANKIIRYLIDIAGYSIERDLIYLEFDRTELKATHKDLSALISKIVTVAKTRLVLNYSTSLVILASWSETDSILSLLKVKPLQNLEVTIITFDLQKINEIDFQIPKANRTPAFLYQLVEPLANSMIPMHSVLAIGNHVIMMFEPLFSERALETLLG
ncbi:MAG: hypothetical protein ACFFBD_22460 [Candidatus Hodarchaeota archaeon]